MKKRKVFCLILSALLGGGANSFAYTTAGDGTTYSLQTLSRIDDSDVLCFDDEERVRYMIVGPVTIARGDRFVMDDDVLVEFDDKATLIIEGEADFRLKKGSTFDSAFDDHTAMPIGIQVTGGKGATEFTNCSFYAVGLRNSSPQGMNLSHCAFYACNGAIGQGALTLGTDGAPFHIVDCHFEDNAKAAIAGAANYRNPLVIERCTFVRNGAANGNTPQLNLTVADCIVVRSCTIEGNPQNTMVGGIVVANLLGFEGDYVTVIKDNRITDNRFGIATYLSQKAFIVDNILVDNNHETNAMNGGSGINVYDPYQTQYTYISGNHIEGSLWGITLVGGKEANLGRTDVPESDSRYNPGRNLFRNNGNGGVLYDLYNNSPNIVYAQGNVWNVAVQREADIENVVFHRHDDASLGEVFFMPPGNPTGISSEHFEGDEANDGNQLPLYDLSGREIVNSPSSEGSLANGIYIQGGKKVIIN